MSELRAVAAAQTVPIAGDVEANLQEHLRLVRAAATTATRVLVFPELSLTGYELALADRLAFADDDRRLGPLVAAAAASRITLVVGAPVRLGPRLHIGAFVISPDGAVGLYTKRYLGAFSPSASPNGIVPPPEATVFHPGDRNPLVVLGDNTAAIAVCADTGRPAHPAAAAERGANTYLASMFFTPAERDGETARLRAYAARHAMAVVFANYGGPTAGLASGGGSGVCSETGALVCQLAEGGAGIALAIEGDRGWRGETIALDGP